MEASVFGREVEIARISQFARSLHDGPAIFAISGDAGIGKTTLWRAAVADASVASYEVLRTRPVATEAKLSFSGLTDLLSTVPDSVLSLLPEHQRQALGAATLRETAGEKRFDPRAVAAAATTVLRSLARRRPVLLAVDDLQWLDPATTRTLESVVRRLGGERIGILVAERWDAHPARSADLERAVFPDRFSRVVVTAMNDHDLRHIVEQRLGKVLPLGTYRRLREVAGGNPFYTLELARALRREGVVAGTSLAISPSLRAIVEERLVMLSEKTELVLLAASAAEHPTLEVVAAGAEMDDSEALAALEVAVESGLVDLDGDSWLVRFAHPLYAAGVYSRAPARTRRRVHRALAGVMPSLELQARHLALGQAGPDSALAEMLDRAAQHARSRGAPDCAAVLASQAQRLTRAQNKADLDRRVVTVARFRFHAGELEPARQSLETLLVDDTDSSTAAAARCLLGEIRYHQHGFGDAQALFTAADAEVTQDPEVGCRIAMHLAYFAVNTDEIEAARKHAQRGLALSDQVDDVGLRAESLAVSVVADYMAGRGLDERRLEQSLRLEDPFHQVVMPLRPSLIAGMLMLYEGRLAEAAAFLESCRDAALDRAEEIEVPLATATLTWCECWRGRLDEAKRHGKQTIEVSRRLGSSTGEGLASAYLSAVEAYQGDAVASRAHAARAFELAEQSTSRLPDMWGRWGLGLLALGQGDVVAAHAVLEPLTRSHEANGLTEPVQAIYLADQIEAMVGVGELDRAERLIDVLEECATRLRRQWAAVGALRCRALLLDARGDIEAASESATAARDWCTGLELRLEVARTLLVSGRIERRRKRKVDARILLQQALEIFDDAGAVPWARRTQLELERVAPRRVADQALTPTELRVAELSGAGLTNREVAARLNISPKTVESNLSRLYRKMSIHSRAELGGALEREKS